MVGLVDGLGITFLRLLHQADCRTAFIVKWHLGSDLTGFGYRNIVSEQGDYCNHDFIDMRYGRVNGYVTDLTTDFALN